MKQPPDVEAWIDQMAPLVGLVVEPEWRDAVLANLMATAAIADLVLAVPLEDHVEVAPVFEA